MNLRYMHVHTRAHACAPRDVSGMQEMEATQTIAKIVVTRGIRTADLPITKSHSFTIRPTLPPQILIFKNKFKICEIVYNLII